ncbi:hypothetical protein PYCC9005_003245 [Savitreella phatthalungensis]
MASSVGVGAGTNTGGVMERSTLSRHSSMSKTPRSTTISVPASPASQFSSDLSESEADLEAREREDAVSFASLRYYTTTTSRRASQPSICAISSTTPPTTSSGATTPSYTPSSPTTSSTSTSRTPSMRQRQRSLSTDARPLHCSEDIGELEFIVGLRSLSQLKQACRRQCPRDPRRALVMFSLLKDDFDSYRDKPLDHIPPRYRPFFNDLRRE